MRTSLHRGKMISKKSTRIQKPEDQKIERCFPATWRSNREVQKGGVLGKPEGEY